MSGRRVLIVNADDLGRSPGINRGILDAHKRGIVTSTTLMVNTAWTEDGVRLARGARNLGVGLHLNFCYGWPISDTSAIPSLVDADGQFKTDTGQLLRDAHECHIRIEALAQLQRFEALMGRRPTHLDSHKYLHSFPPFITPIAAIAAERQLPVRALEASDRDAYRAAGVACPDHFEGAFHGAEGDGVDLGVFLAIVARLPAGVTELMCHPGCVDEHLQGSSYQYEREDELETLCALGARRALETAAVRLATFNDLG